MGTINHCIHGKDAIVEEIVDWRPPEYYTFDFKVPIPGAPKIRATEALTETPDGTRVTISIGRPRSSKDRAFLEGALPMIEPMFTAGRVALEPLLAEELARQAAEAAGQREPSTGVGRAIHQRAVPGADADRLRVGGGPGRRGRCQFGSRPFVVR